MHIMNLPTEGLCFLARMHCVYTCGLSGHFSVMMDLVFQVYGPFPTWKVKKSFSPLRSVMLISVYHL